MAAEPTTTNIDDAIKAPEGKAQQSEGVSLETFLASLAVAAIVFGVQVLAFVLIRKKLHRVYQPRTYLVPDKRKTPAPPDGFVNWFKPIFNTATSDFISKSGLDAYFFLRYLLMLLKTFAIVACAILPILLPMNYVGGRGGQDVQGLDRLAWTNVSDNNTKRYWAHLLLALILIMVFCYTIYDELRKYIRLRQTYLTSPQHRMKASATTVLVSGIPKRWLSVQALVDLYDCFPGGIKNVWINRDFDELQERVDERDKLARTLEKAETQLIIVVKKSWMKEQKKGKKEPPSDHSDEIAAGPGISSGDPHQIPSHMRESSPEKSRSRTPGILGKVKTIPVVGSGIDKVGHGVEDGFRAGFGAVTGGFKKVTGALDRHITETDGIDPNAAQEKSLAPPNVRQESNDSTKSKRGSTLVGPDGQPIVAGGGRNRNSRAEPIVATATEENGHHDGKKAFWRKPHGKKEKEEDERPLGEMSPTLTTNPVGAIEKIFNPKEKVEYEKAYDERYANEDWGDPLWKKFVREKDRPTMRLPLISWLPALPLLGKKVDTIVYCRKEVARLNVEIETDQQHPERYPLMNSAFIQFNQQIAAHMACQSVSHHTPQHMTPRYIEVSPNDVIWGNMRMQWWERYIRSALITIATGALIIGWAVPVGFVGLISQISYLTDNFVWLKWLDDLPDSVRGVISGVLPPLFLGILMAVLPIILRLFARIQGAHTGMSIERSVQGMYFAFLFIQVFLIVSISSSITVVGEKIAKEPFMAPQILAENLPKASNFFFSYLLLQAFSVSGGALLQIVTLLINFVIAPIIDKTPRDKFTRATTLQEIKWGTFYPIYTNLACIGIVYSVISPLILVFNMVTWSLFWVVYRYNLLFVVNFKFDTGGLLFPRALNQLFTGIYVMEGCLIGLLFLVRDAQGRVACAPHAICMVVATILTALFQITLNRAFAPLITYLPVTLEDDAAIRDAEFAQEQDAQRRKLLVPEEQPGDNLNDVLERRERAENHPGSIELRSIPNRGRSDPEASKPTVVPTDRPELALFQDIADEIEDLSPEERDRLVARAFQHPAQRAKRPAIWIPRDELGISDDEIRRTMKMTDKIWISNEFAGVDAKGKVVFRRSPPDLDGRDLVEL